MSNVIKFDPIDKRWKSLVERIFAAIGPGYCRQEAVMTLLEVAASIVATDDGIPPEKRAEIHEALVSLFRRLLREQAEAEE